MVLALGGVAIVCLLTLGTALFVAAEFSLVAADRAELELAAKAEDRAAQRALAAVRTLSFQLSGAQLGITITTLLVGFLAEPSITTLLRPALSAAGLPEPAADAVGVVVALTLATVLQMVLGELVPKNWAIARPTPVARTVAAPMAVFTTTFRPLIAACNGLANIIVRGLGMEPQEELRSARSATELSSLVRNSADQGTLPGETARLIARSLDFGDRVAGHVMTPRTQIISVAETTSLADLLAASQASGHSRFPITSTAEGRPDLDDITHIAHVKKVFTVPVAERGTTPVSVMASLIPQVPQTLHLEPLLALLRQHGLQMAVVIDEYGGTAGIVTLEDVVEELVGAVEDEHDAVTTGEADAGADTGAGAALTVPARLRIDEAIHVAPGFPHVSGPYDTLAGLLLHRLGRLAQRGDQVEVEGWTVTAATVDGHRIDTVTLLPPAPGATAADLKRH
ncbi:MAG TPA: hemolysin family protein [Jatrophihabitans sp.]|uniref:hemolysin family protein n=1 Tax=Jatrophihabitans sp. TaxID=1932789 RepID=UPI002EEC4C5E